MLFNEDKSDARYQITAYDENSITVSGLRITHSVLICANRLITEWPPQSMQDIRAEDLEPLYVWQPEILLIGAGQRSQHLPANLRAHLEQHTIGVECMTSKAACRSYMALLAEDRNVAAMIFPGQ